MPKKTIPAISIVIPMYNAEKYIGECLDSILAQTFKDFEVIVVDDCSTDKSCEIVENYLKKRGGSDIKLIRSKVNSGGCPGIPRNIGMRLSRGEYIMFVDSDDAIIENALEELYKKAKKFDADVVHCDKFFRSPDDTAATNKALLQEFAWLDMNTVGNDSLLSENITERLKKFSECKISWTTCSNFVRRNFLMKNALSFPNMFVAEDLIFTVFLLCLAKNFICTPDTFYIYRKVENSLCNSNLSVEKRIKRYAGSIFRGISVLDTFFNSNDDLKKFPELEYGVFDLLTRTNIIAPTQLISVYAQIPAFQLDPLIRRELEQISDTTALTAFLFARMNVFNVNLLQQQNLIRQQQAQIQQLQAQLQQK